MEKLEHSNNFDGHDSDDAGGNNCSPGRYMEQELNKVIDVVNVLSGQLEEIVERMERVANTVSKLEYTVRRECGRIG